MTRIKIKDLPKDNKITSTELRHILGGGAGTQGQFLQGKVFQGKTLQGRVLQAEAFQGYLIQGCISTVWFSSD
jgi:hypothetical protein